MFQRIQVALQRSFKRGAEVSELIKRAVYVQKINGTWYGYMPLKKSGLTIDGKDGESLGDFIVKAQNDLSEIGIHPTFKCIQNYGLESHLRHVQDILKAFNDKMHDLP